MTKEKPVSVHNEEKRIVEQLSAAMMTKLAVNRYKPNLDWRDTAHVFWRGSTMN